MADRTTGNSDSGSHYDKFLENICRANLTSVDFAEGVTHIGDYAYYGYDSSRRDYVNYVLSSVSLPSTLESISKYAFYGNKRVTAVTFPEAVGSIGSASFANSGLGNIAFLGDPPAIAGNAFSGVTASAAYPFGRAAWTTDYILGYGGNLTWIVLVHNALRLPAFLNEIGEEAFCRINASAVIVGDNVTAIGPRAFAECRQPLTIWIPDSVTDIADNAFENSSVTISASPDSPAWQYAQRKGIPAVTLEIAE